MTDVAMIVVAAAHMCTFAWLLFMRSSHGILCAFGSSVALVAALLWWHLVRPSTHARITLQTLGLGLAGLCLVVRTLLEHWFRRGVAGQPRAAGAAAGGADAGAVGDGALGQSYEGGQQKEVRLQIIGAEQWLIAWRFVKSRCSAWSCRSHCAISARRRSLPPPPSTPPRTRHCAVCLAGRRCCTLPRAYLPGCGRAWTQLWRRSAATSSSSRSLRRHAFSHPGVVSCACCRRA